MASKEIREQLRQPFPADVVRQRKGPGNMKLDYVAGEDFIHRLNEVLKDEEFGYAWQSSIAHVEKTDKGWAVVVHGQLQISGDVGGGIGAMVNPDLDMAAKSANTEAFKNACKNGFAMGLELWDPAYREQLGVQRRVLAGSEQAMKEQVWRLAQQRDPSLKTAAAVAGLFGVKPGDLKDANVLKKILKDEGLLPEDA